MEWVITEAGAALVLVGPRDLFHTLWHPTGRGSLSRAVMTVLWRLARRFGARGTIAAPAGPLSMIALLLMWTLIIGAGWTLVYWPHVPDGFSYGPGLESGQRADIVDGLYLSLAMVGTLGLGDTDAWLRIAAPLEALIGFALLTAAVSWVSQIYPAPTRRRLPALRLASLRATGGLPPPPGATATAVLFQQPAEDVNHVRIDLTQHGETYYFHDGETGHLTGRDGRLRRGPRRPGTALPGSDRPHERRHARQFPGEARRDPGRALPAQRRHPQTDLRRLRGRPRLRPRARSLSPEPGPGCPPRRGCIRTASRGT
ncbi:hypothetical protein ACWGI0_10870 [Streptomyces sp. NPDC054802]